MAPQGCNLWDEKTAYLVKSGLCGNVGERGDTWLDLTCGRTQDSLGQFFVFIRYAAAAAALAVITLVIIYAFSAFRQVAHTNRDGTKVAIHGVSLYGLWTLASSLAPCTSAVYALVYAPSTTTTPTLTHADITGTDHGWPSPATASAATGALLPFMGCVFSRR